MPPAHLKAPDVHVARVPGCTGKKGYVSIEMARKFVARHALSGGNIYHCEHCKFWHYSTWSKRFRPKA